MTSGAGAGPFTYTLRLQPDLAAIAYARLVLRRSLPELDETADALFFGAVTEIMSNAINAQVAADPLGSIAVGVCTTYPLSISITDHGTGFDPAAVPPPTGDESGFGLQIARSVCPDMTISSSGSGTTVTLPYPNHRGHAA